MIKDAEQHAEEDKAFKERVDARNSLESYLYNMKNALENEDGGMDSKISDVEKQVIHQA